MSKKLDCVDCGELTLESELDKNGGVCNDCLIELVEDEVFAGFLLDDDDGLAVGGEPDDFEWDDDMLDEMGIDIH